MKLFYLEKLPLKRTTIIHFLGFKFEILDKPKKIKYKVKSPYLMQKQAVLPFRNEVQNDLYDIFLNSKNKDINKGHFYFPIYYKHFARYKNKPVNILEIGVDKGGSLKMWKEFFGDKANIYGVDIDEKCKQYEDLSNNIHVIIANQEKPDELKNLMKNLPVIDILIDDGGHTTKQQITTFNECYDKIADDGVYLVEDLHTNYWNSFKNTKYTFIEYAKNHIDALNAWYWKKPYTNYCYNQIKNNQICKMPVFTNITSSITFYNSIIVFEKKKKCVPFDERR